MKFKSVLSFLRDIALKAVGAYCETKSADQAAKQVVEDARDAAHDAAEMLEDKIEEAIDDAAEHVEDLIDKKLGKTT